MARELSSFFIALLALPGIPSGPAGEPAPEAGDKADAVRVVEAGLSVDDELPYRVLRGKDELPLYVPNGEELVYEVNVAWGVLGAALGTVTMTAGVEDYRGSLLVPTEEPMKDGPRKTAWLKAHAYGEHLFYTLDATLETRHQPTDWPRILYRSSQGGSESRRREILLGIKDERLQAMYRRDTSKGAPRGTRIWNDPQYRDIPQSTLDMVSAVYLVRTFIGRELATTNFPLINKMELWDLHLHRGERSQQDTPAGRFQTIEVLLDARHYPGEPERDKKKFEGLFGLHGNIHLWVDHRTGIPVRVMGEIPAGPITLTVDISLARFSGTPTALRAKPVSGG